MPEKREQNCPGQGGNGICGKSEDGNRHAKIRVVLHRHKRGLVRRNLTAPYIVAIQKYDDTALIRRNSRPRIEDPMTNNASVENLAEKRPLQF
jgi:hypothetical protein